MTLLEKEIYIKNSIDSIEDELVNYMKTFN